MNAPSQFAIRRTKNCAILAISAVMIWGLSAQHAKPYVLTDENSTLVIDPTVPVTGSSWIVDNVEHMKELSNWYRVGSSGPEFNTSTLNVGVGVLTDADGDNSGFDTVTVPFSDPLGRFSLQIAYSVFGDVPNSGRSSFDEEIRITNLSPTTALPFHFFEYIDLDLYRYTLPNDDIVRLTSQTGIRQSDVLTVGNWGMNVDRYELNTVPNTLNELMDGSLDNLSSVWPNGQGPVGPGDVSFALQWDFVGSAFPRPAIPPLQTVIITKEGLLQMLFVPEPATGTSATVFVTMLLALRRRR